MTEVYSVLDNLKTKILENGVTNTVTTGDLIDIDLDKTTMFPLSHLILRDVRFEDRVISFDLRIMCLDIVDYEKNLTDDDIFYGNDNLQDVLNTQLYVCNKIQMELRRGSLYDSLFQLEGTPSATILRQDFENSLAGWGLEVSLTVPNNDICVS